MRSTLSFLGVLFSVTAACSSGGGDVGSTESPLERCTGTFRCEADNDYVFGAFVERKLLRVGERCMFYGIELAPEGVARSASDPAMRWTGDMSALTICSAEGDCMRCTNPDPTGVLEAAKKCTGSPSSCSSKSPGSCAEIDGCYMDSHLRYNGTWENECAGTPRSCSSSTTERRCLAQGCDWK